MSTITPYREPAMPQKYGGAKYDFDKPADLVTLLAGDTSHTQRRAALFHATEQQLRSARQYVVQQEQESARRSADKLLEEAAEAQSAAKRIGERGSVGAGLLVVIAVVVLILGSWGASMAWQYFTADIRGKVAANEDIKANPQRRIEAYERFYNQCASVQSLKVNRDAQRAELDATKDERRRAQLQTNLSALNAAIAEGVSTYNADSSKTYTAGQFKSSDLPFTLTIEGDTTCAA